MVYEIIGLMDTTLMYRDFINMTTKYSVLTAMTMTRMVLTAMTIMTMNINTPQYVELTAESVRAGVYSYRLFPE